MHCPVWVGVIQKIGVFHQIVSPISNSESTDFFHEYIHIYYASHYDFSTGKLRKNLFWTNKKFVFF